MKDETFRNYLLKTELSFIGTFLFCEKFWAHIINNEYDYQQGDTWHCACIFLRCLNSFSRKIYRMSISMSIMCTFGTNNHSTLIFWLDHKLNAQIMFASPQPWDGMHTHFLKKCHKMCFCDYFSISGFKQLL